MIHTEILSICLNYEHYNKVRRFIDKDMFNRDYGTVYTIIEKIHDKYPEKILTLRELKVMYSDLYPAVPKATKQNIVDTIDELDENSSISELNFDAIKNFWARQQAKEIGEKAVDIYTGADKDIGGLRRLVEMLDEQNMVGSETFHEVEEDIEELFNLDSMTGEFRHRLLTIGDHVPALDRGHFIIVFARPEIGKTTFASFNASGYIRQRKKVTYWANEEPAVRIKLRIIQSYFNQTKEEIADNLENYKEEYLTNVKPYLTVFDSVGTHIDEINEYARIYKPDVMFIDQLDKVHISGTYNRTDEKLKEVYVRAREISKRHECLLWAVSQASYEAEGKSMIDYSMLDNSRTGKAGEADLIIGIGRGADNNDLSDPNRCITISKNKLNGWHGSRHATISIRRGVFESDNNA